jgi:hypothetical protein
MVLTNDTQKSPTKRLIYFQLLQTRTDKVSSTDRGTDRGTASVQFLSTLNDYVHSDLGK